MPSRFTTIRSSSSPRHPIAASAALSSPASPSRLGDGGTAAGSAPESLEELHSPSWGYAGGAPTDEMADTESPVAAAVPIHAVSVHDKSAGHGRGYDGAVVEAAPGNCSSSTPQRRGASATLYLGSRDDDQSVQAEARYAQPQTRPGPLASASTEKQERMGDEFKGNDNDGAVALQQEQSRKNPILHMQSSRDTIVATSVSYRQHAHGIVAPPSHSGDFVLSSPKCGSPLLISTATTSLQQQPQPRHTRHAVLPSALNVVLPRALAYQASSLERAAKNQPLSLSPSTLCAQSVERPASLSKSISQPVTQHTRSSSPSLRSPTPLDLTAPPKRRPARLSDTVEAEETTGETKDPEEGKDVEWRGSGAVAPLKSGQPLMLRRETSSQSARQRPRKLRFSGSAVAASHARFATVSPSEVGRLEACVAPSPSTPHPSDLFSDACAAGAPAAVQAAITVSGESKPERVSTLEADDTLKPTASVTVPRVSLTPASAVAEEPQLPPSSRPLQLPRPLFHSAEPLTGRGSPARPRERRRPSSATRRSVRSADFERSGNAANGAPPCVPLLVPTHESVFFPIGTDVIAPVLLHYLNVAGWSTIAGGRDYFSHRRLRGGEVAGHTVLWLHTAKPRDRFVFLVTPVLNREEASLERDTAAAAEQHRRCEPSSIAGAPPPASGSEGGGSPKSIGVSHGATRAATTTARWVWGKTAKLLQALRTRVFGEAPWFTYGVKTAYACSRIAYVDNDDSLSASSVTTPSGDSRSVRSNDDGGDDDDDVADSVSGSRYGGNGTFRGSTRCLYQSLRHAKMAGVGGSSLRESTPSYNMSPALVAQQSTGASPASVMSAASSPTSLSPTSVGLLLSSPSRKQAATQNTSHAIVSARGSSMLATPNTGLAPLFPLDREKRRCGIYSKYVWSPVTGTAIAASVTSPVFPPQPAPSPMPATSSPVAVSTSSPAVGVEVVVVAHADVTAMDYAPRLTSHRLSIEAKAARTYFFRSLSDALAHYQCEDAMLLMKQQWAAGVTSQIPRPRAAAPRYQQQQEGQRQSSHLSVASRSSGRCSTRVRAASFSPDREPSVHEDDESSILFSPTSRESPRTTADARSCQDSDCRETERLRCGSAAAASARHDFWGSENSEAARESTGAGGGLFGSPLGPIRHDTQPSPPSLPDALSSGLRIPSVSTATSPMAAPTKPQHPRRQHPPLSGPRDSPKCSIAAHGTRDSGRAGLSSTTTSRPSPSFAHRAAGAHATTVSASSDDRLGVTLGPQPYCQFPLQPLLTSSHGEVVVSVYTADPVFNTVLRELLVPEQGTHPYTANVAEQKRLLSMVEVGMPAWSIFYSSTGLPYRRLFRLLYSGLTNLWPLLSLAVGLYDLYKHLPQLKRFMEHTLEPITRWLEQRFTIRVSVLITYLISVVVNIFSSLSSFVSQFYLVQLFSLPIVQLVLALLKLPFVIAFDTAWALATTLFTTVSLALQVVRVVVMAPLVLVMNVASLRDTFGAAVPVALEGTSMSVKWWRAWMEFWETVASPMKNAARAWWDSMMHVSTSAARREMTIRRWTSPKLEQLAMVMGEVQDCLAINSQLWWSYILLPGIELKVLLSVTLVYMYWLFLGISPTLWDEVIFASGVRRSLALRSGQSASQASTMTPATTAGAPAPSLILSPTPAANSHVGAHCKDGRIDVCDDGRDVSVSAWPAGFGSRLYALFHRLPRDGESYSSPSAGTRPPSRVCTEKPFSAAGVGGTPSPTVHLQSQQTFSSLVVELLLPNIVLELLYHVRGALALGCSGALAVASRMTAGHAKVVLGSGSGDALDNASAVLTTSCQRSWAEAAGEVRLGNHTAADAAVVTTDVAGDGVPVERYVSSLIVSVRGMGDTAFGNPEELLRIWQAAVIAKWGDAVGRETPRVAAAATEVEVTQDDAAAASNTHVEEALS
ncbi:hypothetical protein LSCM4_07221 [Leishmania orientalis]|uniref:Uncharacterized protein n=1 Tax=Leishmania orientalis TaxID=2249476 RepID=A0A836HRR6_9TRYP|nr:hypothetical protein LSCM4_07221 [Leishmania orientalis]